MPLSSALLRRCILPIAAFALLAGCTGFGRDPGPLAFAQPDDCFDASKRLHPRHAQACEVPE